MSVFFSDLSLDFRKLNCYVIITLMLLLPSGNEMTMTLSKFIKIGFVHLLLIYHMGIIKND